MRVLADLAERFGHDDLRISHRQNVVLPHVRKADLPAVFEALASAGLAAANAGLVLDIIACPGLDCCALATARSIPVAQQIVLAYLDLRRDADETFAKAFRRVGLTPFQRALYGGEGANHAA